MMWPLLAAFVLMAACVVVHAAGVSGALRHLRAREGMTPRFWRITWLFILVAAWIILLHLVEIAVWGVFYDFQGAMPDLASAMYFSMVTYTTTGYGDLVLPQEWRLVGGVEALTGILMCGWSTGFFVALVHRLLAPSRIAGS